MRPYKTNRALSAEGDLLVEMRVPIASEMLA